MSEPSEPPRQYFRGADGPRMHMNNGIEFTAHALREMKEAELAILRKAEQVEAAEEAARMANRRADGALRALNDAAKDIATLATWVAQYAVLVESAGIPAWPRRRRDEFYTRSAPAFEHIPQCAWAPDEVSPDISENNSDNE